MLGASIETNITGELELEAIRQLASFLGKWPLLLTLANGVLRDRVLHLHEPLMAAFTYLQQELEKRGAVAPSKSGTLLLAKNVSPFGGSYLKKRVEQIWFWNSNRTIHSRLKNLQETAEIIRDFISGKKHTKDEWMHTLLIDTCVFSPNGRFIHHQFLNG